MAIYKRGGRYWVDFYDATGRRHRRAAGTNAKKAREALDTIRASIAAGTWTAEEFEREDVPVFEKAVERYIEDRETRGRKTRSYRPLTEKGVWLAAFKGRRVDAITSTAVLAVLERERKRRKWAPATYNLNVAALSGLFRWCARAPRLWLRENPCHAVERLPVDNARKNWVKPDQLEAIIAHADPRARDAIRLAALTALRYSELCGLSKTSFRQDGDLAWLLIEGRKNGDDLWFPLEGEALAIVQRAADKARFPRAPLFPSPRGGYPGDWLRDAFKAAVLAAGLKYGTKGDAIIFHSLRHGAVTAALSAGVPAPVVQRLGGWKTPSMMHRYAKVADLDLRAGARKLGAAVAGSHNTVTPPANVVSHPGANKPQAVAKSVLPAD